METTQSAKEGSNTEAASPGRKKLLLRNMLDLPLHHRQPSVVSPQEKRSVRVMQMNTLADRWAPPSAFPHTDPAALEWSHRKDLLIDQILHLRPDVVGLEEVDHFADHFQPALAPHGYVGLFKVKNGPGDVDGCALFYNSSKFDLVAHKDISFEGHSQVAQIVRLRLRSDRTSELCVAVTHLKAKEGFEQKRLAQGILLLRAAEEFIKETTPVELQPAVSKQPPLIVVGDFNDIPSSPVCRYFRGDSTEPQSSDQASDHPFNLSSAYALHPPLPGEEAETAGESVGSYEPYSTYKKREVVVRRTIDYVWYARDAFVPVALLEVPPHEALPERLPCLNHPSDHLALCVDLAWRSP